MSDSNWDFVYQSLIDEIVDIQNSTRKAAAKDVADRLAKEGMPANKIKISSDDKSIVASLATDQEYQAGKIYFDKVIDDIDKDKNWVENL